MTTWTGIRIDQQKIKLFMLLYKPLPQFEVRQSLTGLPLTD